MKRIVGIVAVAMLCVAGTAVADGGLIGSGTRSESGNAAGQMLGSGNAAGQTMGSGAFTTATQDQYLGSGGRSAESSQWMGNGGRQQLEGGYFGSGLAAYEIRLDDGSSLLVVFAIEE